MDKTLKFMYYMVLVLYPFLVTKEPDGKTHFLIFSNFLLNVVICTQTLSYISDIILFCFFIAANYECEIDDDCPHIFNLYPFFYRCINHRCELFRLV